MGRAESLARGYAMSTSVKDAGTVTEFGAENLKANAVRYRDNARLIDAVASGLSGAKPRYDSLDDLFAMVTDIWAMLEKQSIEGTGYTPSVDLGFGSDHAGQIADAIIGRRPTVGSTRKAFKSLGA